MSDNIGRYDDFLPEDLVKEVKEYEERFSKKSRGKGRARFPSNEDIVDAIINVTGSILTRYNINDLYINVIDYLKSQGFDTSALTESRVERLVSSLLKKGVLCKKL